MVDLPRAEVALGEVLAFEVSIERYFGFSDSDVAAVGVAVDSRVGAAYAAGTLNAAGVATGAFTGNVVAASTLQSSGQATVDLAGVAVRKISADFNMAGSCTWFARGVTYKPGMRLNDGYLVRGTEGRSTCRPQEHRSSKAVPQPQESRDQEYREVTR